MAHPLKNVLEGKHATGGPVAIHAPGATRAPARPVDRAAPGATLARAIEAARAQLGHESHVPAGATEPSWTRRKPAAVNAQLRLLDLLPEIGFAPSRPTVSPLDRPAGEVTTIADAMARTSRVAALGAHVIVPDAPRLIGDGTGAAALSLVESGLRVIRPAPWSLVALTAGEGEVDETAAGDIVSEAVTDRDELPQRAIRVPMPRSVLRGVGEARALAEIETAIVMGLGRALDATLLTAMEAASLSPWSTGAAAAAGLDAGEMAAVIGRDGDGAVWDHGAVFAGGVAAALSGECDATIIASWRRFGVLVHPMIDLLVERTSADGAVVLTAWCGMEALLPSTDFAWTVAGGA